MTNIWLIFLCAFTFIPFWLVISAAFSSEKAIVKYGFSLWPKEFSLEAFEYLFGRGGTLVDAYIVTITVTVIGTVLAVAITTMFAYAISRPYLKYRNFFSFVAYFTMLFSGGLVPWYITVVNLGLKNTIWAMILPMSFSTWNMFLMRNTFAGLPGELVESAKIDGAGEFRTFWSIMLPIAKPGVATITLFYMLSFWNDWWMAMNFIDERKLYPLQYLLRQIMSNVKYASEMGAIITNTAIPTDAVQMATCLMTIGPIMLAYPFLQKYFVKGITVGAIKG
ncbi:MAG: carbohydrate ABC transporter permease [Roseburia sp.]|nr:carbohydrate ABC transporter permease [Roseburia sp.]